ncbi:MBL fold metallo-hydrolase [Helicobacter sp. 23-1048]
MRKKLWRIFKYILGVFALLCVIMAIWWINMEGIFMSDLKDTKARIANSPHFVNGVAKNIEDTPIMTDLCNDLGRESGDLEIKKLCKSSDSSESQSKFKAILSLLKMPKSVIPSTKSDLSEMQKSDSFVWLGHSSYMLNLGGQRLLIDPILNDNAAPVPFVIRPFHGADIYAPSNIPSVDFLIITHNHYDHLSKSTIRALSTKIKHAIVPLGVGKYLKAWGISEDKITELDWGENVEFSVDFGALRFHCLTARHFSGRGLLDQNKSLWASFLVEYGADSHKSQSKNPQDLRDLHSKDSTDSHDSCHKDSQDLRKSKVKKIFIGGDSGYGAHFAEFGKRFGAIDLAFLENGQYNPQWGQIHTFPHQNLQIAKELNAKAIMPVHNSKFRLAPHEWSEPLEQIYTLYLQGKTQNKFDFLLLTPQVGQIVPLWSEYKKDDFSAWWREVNANPK